MQKAIIWANGIWQGISDLYQGAVNLQNSLSYESYTAAMKLGGLDIGGLQAGNTQALANLSAQVEQLKNALAQIQSIPGYESNAELAGQAAQLQAQIESLGNIITLLTGSKNLTDGTLRLCDGITELKSGVTELNDGTQETKAETEKLSFWQKLINLFR